MFPDLYGRQVCVQVILHRGVSLRGRGGAKRQRSGGPADDRLTK